MDSEEGEISLDRSSSEEQAQLDDIEGYDVTKSSETLINVAGIDAEPWNWNTWEGITHNLWLQLNGLFCLLNLRLCFSAFILYHLTGRWFVILPFATEAFINYVASIFLLAVAQRRDNSIGVVALKLILLLWLAIDLGLNSFLVKLIFDYLHFPNEIIFEPDGVLNSDWGYLHYTIAAFIALTILTVVVEFLFICCVAVSLFSRHILEFLYRRGFRFGITSGTIESHSDENDFEMKEQVVDTPTPPANTGIFTKANCWKVSLIVFKIGIYLLIATCLVLFILSIGSLSYLFIAQDLEYQNCDPIDKTFCLFPWPSTFHMTADSTSETGFRVNFNPNALPHTRSRVKIDPKYWNLLDGFPTLAPMLFYLNDMYLNGMVTHENITLYSRSDCKSIILDADSGEVMPHFVELDSISPDEPLAIIQPASPLRYGRRYIVAVRKVLSKSGETITASPEMLRLINGEASPEIKLSRIQYFQKDIFPKLTQIGWNLEEIQIAWDFVTGSEKRILNVPNMMASFYNQNFTQAPNYRIIKVDEETCGSGSGFQGRTVWGRVEVPSFLSDGRGSVLNMNEDRTSLRWSNTFLEHPFMLRIPCSVITKKQPAFLLQYGHGLFGKRTEARSSYLTNMIERNGWCLVASEWYGMSTFDEPLLVRLLLNDMSMFQILPDNIHQGWLNLAFVLRLMRSPVFIDNVASVPKSDQPTNNRVPLIDPTRFGYWGNSQGGIMGGGYAQFSPDINRAVLGVTGTPFSFILSRSHDFAMWKALLTKLVFFDWREARVTLQLWQMLWSSAETAAWLKPRPPAGNTADPYNGKAFLVHASYGDAQVSILGAQIVARGLNCSTVAPQTREVYGVPERSAPFTGSAYVEWKYADVPDEPFENVPPSKDHDTHECARREPAAQQQIREFLESGLVIQNCTGRCEKRTCPW